MVNADAVMAFGLYQQTRERISALVTGLDDAACGAGVAAETRGLEPPLGDITSHEHDIRGALGRPGARDSAAVRHSSDKLLGILLPRKPVRVIVEDGQYRCGPPDADEIVLRTTRFEALRWRTGR